MLTLGYAIAIVAFIRVGEKLLQKFGARKPMIWGSLIVGLSIVMLMPTNLLIGQYTVLAVAAYTLFGLGLAFYATPSTDAALSNLPDDQAGSGSGLYKMASSLGASFGVAISAAIFTALSADDRIGSVAGRGDHLCRSSGQRGHSPGGADRVGVQSAHGRGGHRVDHAHGPQRPQTRRHAMNALVNEFKGRLETIKAWRHHLHKHPELSLEEAKTAKYIADLVRSWGYDVVEGIGKHGVVASLTAGNGTKSIGLRADTDALPIQEDNDLPYKSEVRRCGASVRPRRTFDDAAGGWRIPGPDAQLQRYRSADLSARRRNHGRRPCHDRGRTVRALACRRRVRHAQHAGARAGQAALSRRRDDGRRRQLGN